MKKDPGMSSSSLPSSVDFHFDPMCPFAFQASLWIREVREQTGLSINWRFFSLEEVNRFEGKKHPWERDWSFGWSQMRIAALLRREDMGLVDAWYLRAGTEIHIKGGKPHDPEVARQLLAEIGADPETLDRALADPTTHDEVRADHQRVIDAGGFGVPTLFFPDQRALFGPVLVNPPRGAEAVRLWELYTGWLDFPNLYEVQRPKAPTDQLAIKETLAPYVRGRDWVTVNRGKIVSPTGHGNDEGDGSTDACAVPAPAPASTTSARASQGSLDKDRLTDALRKQYSALATFLETLPDDAWQRPSLLPGWTIQDIVSHVIGTESWLANEPDPPSDVPVTTLLREHKDITGFNERWVDSLRGASPSAVLQRLREVTAKRSKALGNMTQADFDNVSWTPAGESSYGRFMRIRLFDMWIHEQDIRDVVGQPGHEVGPCAEISFDEIQGALGYVVGKKAAAPQGSSVTFEINGPLYRTLHVVVDGRAALVDELEGPATTTLRLSSGLFLRLAGGRVDPADHMSEVSIEGDVELGRRIVNNLAFTI